MAALLAKPEKRGTWDRDPKSPLREAFERATFQAANQVCRELVVEGPYRARVEAVAKEALEKVFAERDKMVEQVAESFGRAIAEGMAKAGRDWMRDTPLILDCYTPGRYPLVQIVDPYFAPHAQLYQSGPDRTDIDTELVTFLVRRACVGLGLDADRV